MIDAAESGKVHNESEFSRGDGSREQELSHHESVEDVVLGVDFLPVVEDGEEEFAGKG